MHSRKSLLFNEGKPWCKRNSANMFDVAMGSYDGAEICELVGLFILDKLRAEFKNDNTGLYTETMDWRLSRTWEPEPRTASENDLQSA